MKTYIRLFICLCLFGLSALPSFAQTRSIISNLANPAIGFNALFLAQAAPELAEPYGFQFQESEISLISTVDPYWTLAANLVFAPDEVTPEEVFATNTEIENLQIKIGKFKVAFGKHGRLHTHAYPFIQAPVIMGNTIGEEGFNGTGAEVSWLSPLPWFCELTLGAYQAVGADDENPLNFGSQDHANIPILGHLKNLWDLDEETTMELGGSGLMAGGVILDPADPNVGLPDGLTHGALGADLTFRNVPLRQSNQRGWILGGEYLTRGTLDSGVFNRETEGWHAFLQYRWSQNCWTGVRVEEAFNSFSEVMFSKDPLTGDPLLDGNGEKIPAPGHVQRLAANITWTPSEFTAIRTEFSAAKEDPDEGSGTVWDNRVMVQFNYTIGFHPPHAY